jgi:hypothetical protein
MSIPLDRLYHYIDSVAQKIYNDDIVIYRFFPHGSKKIDNLVPLREYSNIISITKPQIYCNDQEPLNYTYYQQNRKSTVLKDLNKKYGITSLDRNFTKATIFDKVILLHSELRSADVTNYSNSGFLPTYYWSHGVIALDWFRYAQHEVFSKKVTKQFLIYNRAWAGTREYRLKFIDLLITYNLQQYCQVSFNPVDPESNLSYTQHEYARPEWKPQHLLENYVDSKQVDSSASADYDADDYNSTDIEIVLETLFDDTRLHLTEKILRPIACGQPFLLAATHGSLEYLRGYGFKTFSSVIDESYDTIEDPVCRLEAIVNTMKTISEWSDTERRENMTLLNEIADYNQTHFFSGEFFNIVVTELKTNLSVSINTIQDTDPCSRYIEYRKEASQYPEIKTAILSMFDKQTILTILKEARKRYQRRKSR